MKAAYEALLAESKRVGWPQSFRVDLEVSDREIIEEFNPPFFVWTLRLCGTYLIRPGAGWAGKITEETLVAFKNDKGCNSGWLWYVWHKRKLTALPANECVELMKEQCAAIDKVNADSGHDTGQHRKEGLRYYHAELIPADHYSRAQKCSDCKNKKKAYYRLTVRDTQAIRPQTMTRWVTDYDQFLCKPCLKLLIEECDLNYVEWEVAK